MRKVIANPDRVLKLHNEGLSNVEIARTLGVSKQRIGQILLRYNIVYVNPNAEIVKQNKARIKEMRRNYAGWKDIAYTLGVPEQYFFDSKFPREKYPKGRKGYYLCPKCATEKKASEFYIYEINGKPVRHAYCRKCSSIRHAEYARKKRQQAKQEKNSK